MKYREKARIDQCWRIALSMGRAGTIFQWEAPDGGNVIWRAGTESALARVVAVFGAAKRTAPISFQPPGQPCESAGA